MGLSPWEAYNCSTTQETPSIIWIQEVYCHVQKSLQALPILNQMNPVHSLPSYFLKFHFNSILEGRCSLQMQESRFCVSGTYGYMFQNLKVWFNWFGFITSSSCFNMWIFPIHIWGEKTTNPLASVFWRYSVWLSFWIMLEIFTEL